MREGSLNFLRSRRTELNKNKPAQDSFNILLYGPVGTGKSSILATCRQPVYIASFDPGGTKLPVLEQMQAEGKAFLDTDYEAEDIKRPRAMAAFEKTYDKMEKEGVFSSLGTFAIDSLTTFGDALMNYITKREGRAGTTPQIQDYLVQQTMLQQMFRKMCALPCDFVVTGHISTDKDEVTGRMVTSLLIPGKAAAKVPVLFDEVLISNVEMDSKKIPTYTIRLVGDAKYKTSTRRFSGDKFEAFEKPDIMRLRDLAGKPATHLEPLNLGEEL